MWLLGPAGFPEGSGEKSISSSSRQNRRGLQKNTSLPCPPIDGSSAPGMETTPGKHGEWRCRAGTLESVRFLSSPGMAGLQIKISSSDPMISSNPSYICCVVADC